jgi:L-lactate dehydrogenase
MKRRVGIIGLGRVGSSVAVSTLHSGIADEILLHDIKPEVAEGEAMDLSHGASFYPTAVVRTASLSEMVDADAVVICGGRNGRPNETRLDLLRDNAKIIRGIGEQLRGCRGVIVMVSNPVDILTLVMAEASGLPKSRVIGTGTMLDTARLRQALGQELMLATHSVHAQVLGEHGDSEFVLWSQATAGGVPLKDWPGWPAEREASMAEEVRTSAYRVIQRKGCTNHAIGLVTADLLKCILRDERRILTVTRVQTGACGLHDVALSLPCVVGSSGATQVLEPTMTEAERTKLMHSAGVLKAAYATL